MEKNKHAEILRKTLKNKNYGDGVSQSNTKT